MSGFDVRTLMLGTATYSVPSSEIRLVEAAAENAFGIEHLLLGYKVIQHRIGKRDLFTTRICA